MKITENPTLNTNQTQSSIDWNLFCTSVNLIWKKNYSLGGIMHPPALEFNCKLKFIEFYGSMVDYLSFTFLCFFVFYFYSNVYKDELIQL